MTQQEFETIAKELRPLMYGTGLRYFQSRDDAEDVAQESLLLLWKYCEKIDAFRNVKALAVKVTKNCCVNMKRRQNNTLNISLQWKDTNTFCNFDASDSIEAKETAEELDSMITRLLAPRERELFEMRQIEGLSNDKIAEITGVKKETVQSMLSAARRKLFDELKRRMKQ